MMAGGGDSPDKAQLHVPIGGGARPLSWTHVVDENTLVFLTRVAGRIGRAGGGRTTRAAHFCIRLVLLMSWRAAGWNSGDVVKGEDGGRCDSSCGSSQGLESWSLTQGKVRLSKPQRYYMFTKSGGL